MKNAALISSPYPGVSVFRGGRFVFTRFDAPHRVLSTCPVNGGYKTGLAGVVNHQMCESRGHLRHALMEAVENPADYLKKTAQSFGIPENVAFLGTSVAMSRTAAQVLAHEELTVAAICTAGVEGNAGRAGDPSQVLETGAGFVYLDPETGPHPGTIIIICLVNRDMTDPALALALMTAAEAKAAALQELCVFSRYSPGWATGTGTDQTAVACGMKEGYRLTGAGKHTKLGELLGQAVNLAVKKAVMQQNGMNPSSRCAVWVWTRRYGLDQPALISRVRQFLPEDQAILFEKNAGPLLRDPPVAAAAAGLFHFLDLAQWGVFPKDTILETPARQAALLAASISGKPGSIAGYSRKLSDPMPDLTGPAIAALVCRALALGFADKWRENAERPSNRHGPSARNKG